MEKISCSCTWGDGNINHNFNKYSRSRQEHIDKERIHENIILKEISNKTIEQEFNKIFEEDVKAYNERQTRNDRKIQSYYRKVLNDKKIRAPYREVIYQVGNKENTKDPEVKEKMITVLKKFYEEFEKNYPRLKVIGAVIHLDEATPHLHLDVVPYADGGKRGLGHKVSFEEAIKQMGFSPEQSEINKEDKVPLIFNGFRNHSMKLLESLVNGVDMQRDVKYNTEKHLSVKEFKEQKAIEDLKASPEIQERAKAEVLSKMENVVDLEKKIKDLEYQKQNKEAEIEELEVKYKKKKQGLDAEYEKQERLYNAKVIEMQNTTIEKEKEKDSFWDKIAERVRHSKLVVTFTFISYMFDRNASPAEIMRGVKKFRKQYDDYMKYPHFLERDQRFFEKDERTDISIEKIESSEEQDRINLKKDREMDWER